VGVPASAIFALQPIDAFLDRGRTVLNIWGDITGAVTRAAMENELDKTVLNGTAVTEEVKTAAVDKRVA
jgi:Na+/H+-dicarboxylate symporter